jgi:hypothetical protein
VKSSKQDVATSDQGPKIVSVPEPLSLIRDNNLSPDELQAYRSCYMEYTSRTSMQGPWPIVLRYLWKEYGLTFANESVMSAVLLIRLPTCEVGNAKRYSRFMKSTRKAIATQKVSTDHLFAIFLVITNSPSVDHTWAHLIGFVTVLRHLIENSLLLTGLNNCKVFLSLLGYIISVVRRYARQFFFRTSERTAYEFICNLRYLSERLQHPSQSFAHLVESPFFDRREVGDGLFMNIGGLLQALNDALLNPFVFVYEMIQARESQAQSGSRELDIAEQKLRVLENSTIVKEIFTHVPA